MASVFSKLFFSAVRPLMDKAALGKALNAQDACIAKLWPELSAPLQEKMLFKRQSGVEFLYDLLNTFRRPLVIALLLNIVFVAFEMAQPLLVKALVSEVERGRAQDMSRSTAIALTMGALAILNMLALQHGFHYASVLSVRLRAFIADKLARIALINARLDKTKMLGHLSADVDAAAEMPLLLVDTLVFGSKIIIGICLLAYFVGWSSMTAVLLFLVATPAIRKVIGRFQMLRTQLIVHRNERISLTRALLTGFRLLRVHGWMQRFSTRIMVSRGYESGLRAQINSVEAWTAVVFTSLSAVITVAVLTTYSVQGGELNTALVAAILSVVALLNEPFAEISSVSERWANALVGAKRLSETLASEPESQTKTSADNFSSPGHSFSGLTFVGDDKRPLLHDISFTVAPGERVAIIGPIRAGKTLLLQVLSRELPAHGEISYIHKHCGLARIAFVSESPFLFNTTIRDNLSADDIANREVLNKVGFQEDLQTLPLGLYHPVGLGGALLSGGQRQRLAFARALLAKPDVLLLDDPLSGADSKLAHTIARRVLGDRGAYPQAIIIATQRNKLLPYFDKVLVLEQGKLVKIITEKEIERVATIIPTAAGAKFPPLRAAQPEPVSGEPTYEEGQGLVQKLSAQTLQEYFSRFCLGTANSRTSWILLLALSAAGVAGPIFLTYWLGRVGHLWNSRLSAHTPWIDYAASYPALALSLAFFIALTGTSVAAFARIAWTRAGLTASNSLHNQALGALVSGPPSTVDDYGSSRILNQLIYDVSTTDIELPRNTESSAKHILYLCLISVLFVFALPILILPLGGILVFYWREQRLYRPAARSSKRLQAESRIPLLTTFQELMIGGSTIRSLGLQEFALARFQRANQVTADGSLVSLLVNRYFSVRVTTLGAIVSAFVALAVVLATARGNLTAPLAATLLSLSLTFWDFLNWTIRTVSELEAKMTAAERLLDITKLAPEVELPVNKDSLQATNPTSLELRNIVVFYPGNNAPVLGPVSVTLFSGKMKALIGRSGSGKTTLLRALTGQVKLAGGEILLGGIPVANALKSPSDISWVPQQTWLFEGILQEMGLALALDAPIATDGSNLSLGSRQIIGVIRGILRRPKLLLLDEPTSGIDEHVEEQMMLFLERLAVSSIVIIVAHKPTTITRCSEILNLNDGILT